VSAGVRAHHPSSHRLIQPSCVSAQKQKHHNYITHARNLLLLAACRLTACISCSAAIDRQIAQEQTQRALMDTLKAEELGEQRKHLEDWQRGLGRSSGDGCCHSTASSSRSNDAMTHVLSSCTAAVDCLPCGDTSEHVGSIKPMNPCDSADDRDDDVSSSSGCDEECYTSSGDNVQIAQPIGCCSSSGGVSDGGCGCCRHHGGEGAAEKAAAVVDHPDYYGRGWRPRKDTTSANHNGTDSSSSDSSSFNKSGPHVCRQVTEQKAATTVCDWEDGAEDLVSHASHCCSDGGVHSVAHESSKHQQLQPKTATSAAAGYAVVVKEVEAAQAAQATAAAWQAAPVRRSSAAPVAVTFTHLTTPHLPARAGRELEFKALKRSCNVRTCACV
jgi:hypothetical protein